MLKHEVYHPSENLKPYISGYIFLSASDSKDTYEYDMLPSWSSGISLSEHSDSFLVSNALGELEPMPQLLMSGLNTTTRKVIVKGKVQTVNIEFFPGALNLFLKLPLVELKDSMKDIRLLEPTTYEYLAEQLFDVSDSAERVKLLNTFFEAKMGTFQLVHFQKQNQFGYRLQSFGKQTGSRILLPQEGEYKKLERIFLQKVGITPKKYQRMSKFYTMYQKLKVHDSKASVHDLMMWGEYYDQSHLTKATHQFASATPEAFLKSFQSALTIKYLHHEQQ